MVSACCIGSCLYSYHSGFSKPASKFHVIYPKDLAISAFQKRVSVVKAIAIAAVILSLSALIISTIYALSGLAVKWSVIGFGVFGALLGDALLIEKTGAQQAENWLEKQLLNPDASFAKKITQKIWAEKDFSPAGSDLISLYAAEIKQYPKGDKQHQSFMEKFYKAAFARFRSELYSSDTVETDLRSIQKQTDDLLLSEHAKSNLLASPEKQSIRSFALLFIVKDSLQQKKNANLARLLFKKFQPRSVPKIFARAALLGPYLF